MYTNEQRGRRLRVLVSGASIAGPALAYWLSESGHEVTVVEQSSALRGGGQAVDFKGATHRAVLERMDLWDAVHQVRTAPTDLHVVDAAGRTKAVIPHEFSGGDVEILRGDLGVLLYERTRDRVEYVFDDRIEQMEDLTDAIDVVLRSGRRGRYDLVVGADGVHSGVRRLAFGHEEDFVQFLNHYYAVVGPTAAASPPQQLQRSQQSSGGRTIGYWYNEPGRLAAIGGSKAPDMFVFASKPLAYHRRDVDQQKSIVASAFADSGWRVPEMLARLEKAEEFYLDGINRVRMDGYSRRRVALVGDAAYANTLGGFGTGLAIVGAYTLAGELAAAGNDVATALHRYDQVMHPYARIARRGNAGGFLAPRSAMAIRLRDLCFRNRLLYAMQLKLADAFANDVELPAYPELSARPASTPKETDGGSSGMP